MKISSINYCGVVTRPAEIPNITENPHSWVRLTRKRAIPAFADGSEKMKLLISNWDHSSYYFLHSSSCEFGKNLLCVCDWTVWVWVGAVWRAVFFNCEFLSTCNWQYGWVTAARACYVSFKIADRLCIKPFGRWQCPDFICAGGIFGSFVNE